jgi:ParB family chromosome partitioning protein
LSGRSERSRVERLRRDLKNAPPAVPVVETKPAKAKRLGRGLASLMSDEARALHGVEPLKKTAEQVEPAPPIPSRRARGSSRRREQLGAAPAGDARGAASQAQELPAMSNFLPIPLKDLAHSDLNVRKTDIGDDIVALGEDILEHGLLQNLVVIAFENKIRERTMYEVVAGGRRLRALQYLWDEGKIDENYMVACKIEDAGEGRSASLAENLHRIAMNPADEFLAYQAIVADHATDPDPLAYCARRFRVSRQHVEQRLRLAALAPAILDALRDGRLGVEAARSYGSFADHDLQLKVFTAEEKRTYGTKHDPRAVRDALKTKTYPAGIIQAAYVGLDAYHAAGGRSEREFFMGADDGDRLIDPALLDKLAREKATAELDKLWKRDGFAGGVLTAGFSQFPNWPPAPAGYTRDWGARPDAIAKADRAKFVGCYSLVDGKLAAIGVFKPQLQSSQTSQAARDAAWREQQRREVVIERAARMSVPTFEGTPFEGRARLPDESDLYEHIVDRDDGKYVVVLVKVTAEEIAAHEAEAEAAIVAEEEAEIAEEVEKPPIAENDGDTTQALPIEEAA